MKIDIKKIDLLIADRGMMLKDVAIASDLTEQAFRNIRTGNAVPRLRTIGKIASALGVGVQEIIIQEGEAD